MEFYQQCGVHRSKFKIYCSKSEGPDGPTNGSVRTETLVSVAIVPIEKISGSITACP